MRIVMAGASGLIGTALSSRLASDGHDVVRLVRRPPESPSEIPWDPATGTLDPASLEGAGAVINLSGANIGARPWTPHRIDELFRSRLDPTRTLTAAMRSVDSAPPIFISQSGAGYYGDAGAALLTESSPAGQGIMARICVEWEAAAHEAPAGVRVGTPRPGGVLSRSWAACCRCCVQALAARWATAGSTGPGSHSPTSPPRSDSSSHPETQAL
jgi:NAD dependent epimerase/dehydratase family enzyme